MFEFGAASLVVTRSSLLFMESNAILSGRLFSFARLSGAGWQVYFLLSSHDLKKLRVIKESFMGKVMLRFVGNNSNMAFAITDVVIWLFKFAVKYIIYFTEF